MAAFLDHYGGSEYRLAPFSAVDVCTVCAAAAKLHASPAEDGPPTPGTSQAPDAVPAAGGGARKRRRPAAAGADTTSGFDASIAGSSWEGARSAQAGAAGPAGHGSAAGLLRQAARKLMNERLVPGLSLVDTSMLLWAAATLHGAPGGAASGAAGSGFGGAAGMPGGASTDETGVAAASAAVAPLDLMYSMCVEAEARLAEVRAAGGAHRPRCCCRSVVRCTSAYPSMQFHVEQCLWLVGIACATCLNPSRAHRRC